MADHFVKMADRDDDDQDAIALDRDRVYVRSLRSDDIDGIVRVDRRITGLDRTFYYQTKLREALDESGIRVSLVAEIDGAIAGFVMARVDFGEFGRTESVAVLDTIDVDPGFRGLGIGRALLSQLFANLGALRVEAARTTVDWDAFELLGFLHSCGFEPSQRLVLTRPVG